MSANFKIKRSLRKSGFKEPLQMLFIMLLFIIGIVTFPTRNIVGWFYKGESEFVFCLFDGIERILFTLLMLVFIGNFGFRIIPRKTRVNSLFVFIPAMIIALNNFPFVAFFSGDCAVSEKGINFLFFGIWCLGTGLFEEVAFRGVIMPLCFIYFKNKKRPVFFTVAVSSAIFALSHLINLFSGNIGGTFLQVGYTFLIGAMCGIIVAKTGNVLLAVITHTVYNFCGMIVEYCGSGVMWTWPQIACTAIVGVIIGVYMIIVAFKADKTPECLIDMLGDDPTGVENPV